MEKVKEARKKTCPVCEKEYPEEDSYCGYDGSLLQQKRGLPAATATAGNPGSK